MIYHCCGYWNHIRKPSIRVDSSYFHLRRASDPSILSVLWLCNTISGGSGYLALPTYKDIDKSLGNNPITFQTTDVDLQASWTWHLTNLFYGFWIWMLHTNCAFSMFLCKHIFQTCVHLCPFLNKNITLLCARVSPLNCKYKCHTNYVFRDE